MGADELIPELHDVGKLLDNEALASQIAGWPQEHGGHTFTDANDEPINLTALGLPQPDSFTWHGVVNHHERIPRGGQITDPNVRAWRNMPNIQSAAPQLVLLLAADHLAASTSRSVEQERGGRGGPWLRLKSTTRQCLWKTNGPPADASLIRTEGELADLLQLLCQHPPPLEAFSKRYGALLKTTPEEKGFPRAVTTLETHINLVGRYYRVLRRYSEASQKGRPSLYYNGVRALSCAEVEQNWRFRLARCRVRIPGVPARLRDLGIFQRLEAVLDSLQADPDRQDHALLTTFQHLWVFLPLEDVRSMEDALRPLLDAGFHVEARVREAPLTNLTAWGNREHEAEERFCYLQREPGMTINPPLCEVCQLAQGQFWQKRPDDVPEYLCATCADTREQHSQRFQRLEDWDTGYAAWLRVFLDFDALVPKKEEKEEGHLKQLFRQYVATKGKGIVDAATQEQLVENLRTTALTVDYVNDFQAMQDDLAGQLKAVFSEDDVEALTAKRKELFVVRLDNRSDVFRVLELCHVAASRHFPRSLSKPPFRFATSIGPVRFPFGEHWRLLQEAHDEVTVSLVGSGRLTCRLDAVPELLSLAKQAGAPRRGLHRLANLAGESPALAKVALADRKEHELAGIAPRLQQLGLDFESIATFARLTKE